MSSRVEVFVLSFNRAHFLREAVQSIQAQTYSSVKLIVSENSTNEEAYLMLIKEFPEVEVRRRPKLTSENHFNQVLAEASTEYLMIFHDDDRLHPDAIQSLVDQLDRHSELSAVASNAYVIRDNRQTQERFSKELDFDLRLNSSQEMIDQCIRLRPLLVPFSGYLYRRSFLSGVRFSKQEGRKYLDVSFLLKLNAKAPILWLATPKMDYRFHSGNDSGAFSIVALNSLMRNLERRWGVNVESLQVGLYRIKHHLLYFHQLGWKKYFWQHPHRRKVLLKGFIRFCFRHPSAVMQLAGIVLRKAFRFEGRGVA